RLGVTETDFARDFLREKVPRHACRVQRVFNGIHVDKFAPVTLAEGTPRIVSVGRLIEKKGFHVLIEACAILKKRGVAFVCHIVGTGPLEAEMRAQIERLGLAQDVILEGARTEPEVMDFLRNARVFALACTREKDGGMDN